MEPFEDFKPTLTAENSHDTVPRWAVDLNHNLSLVYNKQIAAETLVTKIHGIVEELKPTVMEVVDGLQKNPMFKMLLGGKR